MHKQSAVAGSSKPAVTSPASPRRSTAPAVPVTTRKDLEHNTYTPERSKRLREGNVSAR